MSSSSLAALRRPAADPRLWPLDPAVVFLNHGSFGSCPLEILEAQNSYRMRMERRPIYFLVRELEPLLDEARAALAQFVGADPADLVFVNNATSGVNTVLRSLRFRRGDEWLVTDQEYNACRNALNHAAERSGVRIVVAKVPFPVRTPVEIVEAILPLVTPRTKLALLDHVTSQTALIFPVEDLVARLSALGVETLIDGAHAPGMVPLRLSQLGATYYTGNCHKWLCAPKGAAFLYVRRDRQPDIRPLTVSHGANSPRTDRSRFQIEFAWTGTGDPSAALCVPLVLRYMAKLLPGGWKAVMRRNHQLALAAREVLARSLRVKPVVPAAMIGSMAALPLPDGQPGAAPQPPFFVDPLQDRLREEAGIEVPVMPWPAFPRRLIRVSAQLYNSLEQYEQLADLLASSLSAAAFSS